MAGFQYFPEGVRHWHRLRVRYADTDRMDMVYHGTYAAYLEAARVEMMRDAGWVYAEAGKGRVCCCLWFSCTFLTSAPPVTISCLTSEPITVPHNQIEFAL